MTRDPPESAPYTCDHCGGTFVAGRPDEEAQQEAVALWGRRGDAPGMATLCDDCWRQFMAWYRTERRPDA